MPLATRLTPSVPAGPMHRLPARPALLERDAELDALEGAVARLADEQRGRVVTLEAPAGGGKTALVEHAAAIALAAGCRVRRAAPGPLERRFAFGVLRALLEATLWEAGPAGRARLLDGAAAPAGPLLLDGVVPEADAAMPVAHAVLRLCVALCDEQPLVLVVDDAQCADRRSLEALSYLARRAEDLPLLLVVAFRGGDPDAANDLLSLLGGAPAALALRPAPLTAGGAVRLIRRVAPDAPVHLCRRSHEAAGGNPWLTTELARQLRDLGADRVQADATLPASTVAREVIRRRLAALRPRDRAAASALAVLETADPEVVAAVAGLDLAELVAAGDALAAAGVVTPDRARIAHPIVATALLDDLPQGRREHLHRRAAEQLAARGAAPEAVAGHLLRCAPQGDPGVSRLLRDAAGEAWSGGAPEAAAAYLERALDERAPDDDRAAMLAQLATLAFDARLADARPRLEQALAVVDDRASRIDILTRLATLSVADPADDALAALVDRERQGERDGGLRLALDAASLDALLNLPDRHEERRRRAQAIELGPDADPLLRRVVLAHRVCLAYERGEPDAEATAALALAALDGDVLLAEARQRSAFHLCVRALVFTDHVDAAEATLAALREEAERRGSTLLAASAALYRAMLALRAGRVADAEAEARRSLSLGEGDPLNVITGGAVEVLVAALAERGAVGDADAVLVEHDLGGDLGERIWDIGILHARARLGLARGAFDAAHRDAVRAGALREQQGRANPALTPWRSTAALALAHVGRGREAAVLADRELALARRFGAPLPIATALHARIVAEADPEARLALCTRGPRRSPPSLAALHVLVEHGGTLARLGRRVAAREPLQQALAGADAGGATLLAARARRELVATGVRPRRAQHEGPAALTPRQRQICELAAAGVPNRAIAQQLFLSVKTVETHLATAFRKLGVDGRGDLAAALDD